MSITYAVRKAADAKSLGRSDARYSTSTPDPSPMLVYALGHELEVGLLQQS